MSVTTVTDADFVEFVSGADKPVLVDLWAEWCGPCKKLSPILDDFAEQYGDLVQVAKLNVDDNPKLAATYGVMSIPTLLLFSGDELVGRWTGSMTMGRLVQELQEHLLP